jgi:hypothetical protein
MFKNRKSKLTDLHPYFTPVAGSFSAKLGKIFATFFAKSRSNLSGTGTAELSMTSAMISGAF